MMKTNSSLVGCGWYVVLVAAAPSGCTEAKIQYPLPMASDYPAWVYQGSGAIKEGDRQVIVGVGVVNGVQNATLAKTAAANRARNEVAKVLETYSASLMKDYAAATTAGDTTATAEEQHVEQAIKTFAAKTMDGVTVTDFWYAPDGSVFARAMLDFSLVPELAQRAELKQAVRDFVRENAQKSFDELERQEACQQVSEANPTPAVDILFVIDDSGSMQEEQANLARNFANFFDNLKAINLDYHVAVVTTDVDHESTAGHFVGEVKVLESTTPELEKRFKENVAVGTSGSTQEKGLEAVRLALGGPNGEGDDAGFLRETARLAVIVVSDENDQSPLPVSQYTAFLAEKKGGLKKVSFAALVGEEGGCHSLNGNAAPGTRYVEAAHTFGEYGIVQSICQDDFAGALRQISGQISEASSRCRQKSE